MVIFGERRTVCSGLVGVRVGCLCMRCVSCVLCGVWVCVGCVCVGGLSVYEEIVNRNAKTPRVLMLVDHLPLQRMFTTNIRNYSR